MVLHRQLSVKSDTKIAIGVRCGHNFNTDDQLNLFSVYRYATKDDSLKYFEAYRQL